VVVPLFAFDQWANAAAVARAGAGIALTAERTTRQVLGLPSADTIKQLAPTVARVLDEPAYGREARRIADAARTLPPVDSAVAVLTQLARQDVAA
jgi:UDP:flavonoid glycosyltransferase YjiC (YdhE family)